VTRCSEKLVENFLTIFWTFFDFFFIWLVSCGNKYYGTNFIYAVPTSLLIAPGLRTIQFLFFFFFFLACLAADALGAVLLGDHPGSGCIFPDCGSGSGRVGGHAFGRVSVLGSGCTWRRWCRARLRCGGKSRRKYMCL
jgi:hypothetical protein